MSRKPIALLVALLLCVSVLPAALADGIDEDADSQSPDSIQESAENKTGPYENSSAQDGGSENSNDSDSSGSISGSQETSDIGIHSSESRFSGKHVSFEIDGAAISNFRLDTGKGENFSAVDKMLFPANLTRSGEGCKASFSCGCIGIDVFDTYCSSIIIRNNGTRESVEIMFPENFSISKLGSGFRIERPHDNWDLDITVVPLGSAQISDNNGTLEAVLPGSSGLNIRFGLEDPKSLRLEANHIIDAALANGNLGAEINLARGTRAEEYSVRYREMEISETSRICGKANISIDSAVEKGCMVAINLDRSIVTGDHLETIRVMANGVEAAQSSKLTAVSTAVQQLGTILGVDKYLYYLEKSEDGVRLIMSVPHFSLLDLEIVDLDVVFPNWETQQTGTFDDFLDGIMGTLSGIARENIDLDALIDVSSIDFNVWQIVTSGGDISIDIGIHLDCNISVLKLDTGLKEAIQSSAGGIPLDALTLQDMLLKPYITADQIRVMLTGPVEEELEDWMRQRVEDTIREGFAEAEIKQVVFDIQNRNPIALDGDLLNTPVLAKVDVEFLLKYPIGLSALLQKSDSPEDPEVERLKSENGIQGIISYPTKFNLNASAGWRYDLMLSVPEQYQFVYSNRNASYGSVDSSSIGWEMDAKNSAAPLSAKYVVGVSSERFIWAIFIAGSVVVMVIATLIGTVFFIARARRK